MGKRLFNNAFFKVFGQIGTHLLGCALRSHFGHVAIDHEVDEFLEARFVGIPAQFGLGLGGVAPQIDDIRRAIEVGTDFNEHFSRGLVNAFLVDVLALELQFDAHTLESIVTELAYTVLYARSDDEIFRFVVLQDEPHALHVVLGIAPVAQ